MSDTSTPARPRQLTMAGGFVIGGSIFLVLSIFDMFGSLQSVETREAVTKALSSPTGRGLGISVDDALALMRVGLMVAAACAAASAVLGVYALQRNRAARVALSVLAVPILLTAPLTGGLMGALVAAATLMLWSGPARDWFAGRPVREPATRGSGASAGGQRPPASPDGPAPDRSDRPSAQYPTDPPPSAQYPTDAAPGTSTGTSAGTSTGATAVTTTSTSTTPAATTGFGERPVQQTPPPAGAWPAPSGRGQGPGSGARTPVPMPVKLACVLTWVFSGLVALLYAGMLVTLAVAQDSILDYFTETPEFARANIDQDMLVPLLWVGCLLFLGWAVGACVLAWFVWRRHTWARWLLVVSAAASLVAGLFAFPVGIPHQVAAAVTIAGLLSGAARTWFAPTPWGSGPPNGPNGPSGPPAGPAQEAPSQAPQGAPQDPSRGPGGPPVW